MTSINGTNYGSQYSLLNSQEFALECEGDMGAQIALMTLKSARDSREAAEATRDAEEANLLEAQTTEIEEMHAQADKIREAAWLKGLGQVGVGAAQATAAFTGQNAAAAINGSAQATQAVTNHFASNAERAAANHELAATSARHSGERTEKRLEDIDQAVADARELQRTALDFQRQISQNEASAGQAALFQRV